MERNNWFDDAYDIVFAKATAAQALADIANDPKIVKALEEALDAHDRNVGRPGWVGRSRTQAIRNTVARVLEEQKDDTVGAAD